MATGSRVGMADVLVLRSQRAQREARSSEVVRAKVDEDLERVRRVAEQIRHMTELYIERLEGRRRVR